MNADHADAMVLYCKAFSKATEITSARMTGIDRYGFEMSAKTGEGPRPIRLAFTTPIRAPEDARAAHFDVERRQAQARLSPPGLWQAYALHDDVHHSRSGSRR